MTTTATTDLPRRFAPDVRANGRQWHLLRPETRRLLVDLFGEPDAGLPALPAGGDLPQVAGGGSARTRQCGTAAGVADVGKEVHGCEGSRLLTLSASISLTARRIANGYHCEMRPIADIRRENLARLVRDAGGPTRFAELIDPERASSKKSQVQQWLMAPGPPNSRNLGSRTARKIEKIAGKPEGWLDTEHDAARELFSPPESHLLRPDPEILHAALLLIVAEEGASGRIFKFPQRTAERLADLYGVILRDGGRLSTENNARLVNQAIERAQTTEGVQDVRVEDGGESSSDQRGSAEAR